MAHCPPENLRDIEDVLKEVRKLENVQEKGPGIFYLKSKGFLHFHMKDGRRWADARDGDGWGSEIVLPIRASRSAKQRFLAEIRIRYRRTLGLGI